MIILHHKNFRFQRSICVAQIWLLTYGALTQAVISTFLTQTNFVFSEWCIWQNSWSEDYVVFADK